jgi:hypothetical protein
MDWNAAGALGEVLGAIAVVFTLAYLAKQVRQSNRIAKAEAFRSARLRLAGLLNSWADHEDWSELFVRIRFSGLRRDDLTPRERAVTGLRYQSMVHHLAATYEDVRIGILPPSAYDILGAEVFKVPYMRDVWPLLRNDHSPDFVDFFETRFGLHETSDSAERIPPGQEARRSTPMSDP